MAEIFQTARLRATMFSAGDAAFILQLLNTAGWLRYIGDRHVRTLVDAEKYLSEKIISHYNRHGFGMWKLSTIDDGSDIGMAGFVKREALEKPDLGFALLPEYSGKGYASEATAGCLLLAKTILKLPEVWAIVQEDNEASKRTLLRAGFSFLDTVQVDTERLLRFSIRPAETGR